MISGADLCRTFGSCLRRALELESNACEATTAFSSYLQVCAEECQELAREQERARKVLKDAATRDDKQVFEDESARDKVGHHRCPISRALTRG